MDSLELVEEYIAKNEKSIQCVVSPKVRSGVAFGAAQQPKVHDYADKVDTMAFLLAL